MTIRPLVALLSLLLIGCSKPDFIKVAGDEYYDSFTSLSVPRTIPLYSLTEYASTSQLGALEAGAEIDVVGETYNRDIEDEYYSGGYYLVHSREDKNLWTGWVKKSEIQSAKWLAGNYLFFPRQFSISPQNDKLAFVTRGEAPFLKVLAADGLLLVAIDIEQFRRKYRMTVDGRFLGWSSDSKEAWFDIDMEGIGIALVKVNILQKNYEVLDFPKLYNNRDFQLDFDSEVAVFSDYPRTMEPEKFGRMFHLYKGKIRSNHFEIVAENYDSPFSLKNNGNKSFSFIDVRLGSTRTLKW